MLISGPADAELSVVLFRGGWADANFSNGLADAGTLPAADIASAAAFAGQLDQWGLHVFGSDFAAHLGGMGDQVP
ncbi:hypothetical protein ACFU9Y_41655 [Streptomyces sp. NPDC057621]|uniref:hypothetical protein n=1 Tax=Streptomyces sp. NPDC057621 TaxID=3346186 RepID=UPI0036B8C353